MSWRVLATLTTMVIAYIVIGDISDALKIGAVEVVAKMLIYYFHERAGHRFHWAPCANGQRQRKVNTHGLPKIFLLGGLF